MLQILCHDTATAKAQTGSKQAEKQDQTLNRNCKKITETEVKWCTKTEIHTNKDNASGNDQNTNSKNLTHKKGDQAVKVKIIPVMKSCMS